MTRARDDLEKCNDCGGVQPPTDTNYTLSSQHGWRCVVARDNSERKVAVWRCGACWAKHRQQEKTVPGFRATSTFKPVVRR